jgi:hypothetical protein
MRIPGKEFLMDLIQVVDDFADALVSVDRAGIPFKQFQPGVGPYGEPQVVRAIAHHLNTLDAYRGRARTKRCPDLLIEGFWAIEVKLARPFGDNGREAENWSVNLLHPYEGNVSVIGDCLKLDRLNGHERRAVVVIGYEHTPPRISLTPLLSAFEAVARSVSGIELAARVEARRDCLVHPVHQQLIVVGWEVLGRRM